MRKILCSILFFSIACTANLYAQANFKLLEDNSSPTLKAAVEAHKRKDSTQAEALYTQYTKEWGVYISELATKDSSYLADLNLDLWGDTDWLHCIYNIIVYYTQVGEPQELREQMEIFLIRALDETLNRIESNPILHAHFLTLGAYFADNTTAIESYHLRAIQIYKEQLGDQHITYADEVSRLAHFYLEKSECLKAEELLLPIIPVFQTYYDRLDFDYVSLLIDLMITYFELNNFSKAVKYGNEVLDLLVDIEYADTSSLISAVSRSIKMTEVIDGLSLSDMKSMLLCMDITDINTKIILEDFGELSDQYIGDLIERGFQEFVKTNIKESDLFYKKALALEKKRNEAGSLLYNEIQYAIRANATKESRIHRLKKIRNGEEKVRGGTQGYNINDINLALSECYSDNIDSASYYLSEFQKLLTKQAEEKIPFFTEEERENWWKFVSLDLFVFKFSVFVTAFGEHDDLDEFESPLLSYCYNAELFSKSILSTSSQKLRQAIFSSGDPQLINTWGRLFQLKKENNPANEIIIHQLERSIVKESQAYRDKSRYFDIEWTDIKKRLLSGEAAIEFIVFNGEHNGEFQNIYMALQIRADYDYPKLVWYALEKDLIEAIHSKDKNALYEVLWLPIEQYLKNDDVIYLAPAGLLHSIPFGGISYGNGKHYLCENYTIHNLLSTRDVIKLKEKRVNANRSRQIALFGGADYLLPANDLALLDKDVKTENINNLNRSVLDEMDPSRGPGFLYLPGTKREVQQIDKQLNRLNWKTSLFTDHHATETRFKSLASNQSPEVIHISTHGFYFPQPKADLSPNARNTSNVYRLSDNPLMRSGLAFAGANHVWKGNDPVEGTDDGILTAYEISNLNLFNTELVVLSACNTGLGDVDFGEGVYGLQRAFRLAGVETIIVSLWEVPDKETVELMTKFYSFWGAGMSKKEAFNKAQLKMRYAYPAQPQKWAGFIMIE